jgi:hypothetical protein
LRIFQKTSNNSRNHLYIAKLFIRIHAEIAKLSSDMYPVAEYLVLEGIFAIYPIITHGIPWVSDF